MIQVGEEVKIAYGVYFEGYDLSGQIGTVIDTKSYIQVWIPALKIKAKLFQSEIHQYVEKDIFDEITEEFLP